MTTSVRGYASWLYASPQQRDPRGRPDPRDDVHALGVMWFQLLVGDLGAEPPRGSGWKKRLMAVGVSRELLDLVEECMATDADDRPADGAELADKITAVLAPPLPPLPPPPPPLRPQYHR
ncbi:MAG: hypothetical protein K2X87_32480 [Gemmataceae bacterium]|nr:hypothetical protein [Gemmataceae bacterium]